MPKIAGLLKVIVHGAAVLRLHVGGVAGTIAKMTGLLDAPGVAVMVKGRLLSDFAARVAKVMV